MMALGWAANGHPSTSSSLDSSAIFEALLTREIIMSDEDIKLASTAMLLLKLATPRADLTIPERIKIALEVQIRIRLLEAKVSRMQQEIALHDDKLMEQAAARLM